MKTFWRDKNMREKEVSPELVKLETNVSYIPYFGFCERLVDARGSNYPIKLRYIVKRVNVKREESCERFENYYKISNEEIYYEEKLGLGITLKMLINYKKLNMLVQPLYHKLIKFNIHCVSPPGAHLKDFLCLSLLERGFATLHSSAFSYEDNGVIIVAPSNTGKTWSVFHAVKNFGCKFLSEDISIINGKYVFGCPWTSTFIDSVNLKGYNRILQILSEKLPVSRPFLRRYIRTEEVIGRERIASKAKIRLVFILKRGKKEVKNLNTEEALIKILTLNRYEFPYCSGLVNALQFFGFINIDDLLSKEEEIIRKTLETSNIYLLSGTPEFFVKKIESISREI